MMVDFFDNIEVLPGLHANGTLTLGENLADHGGLNVAYLAYKNATANAPLEDKDGFTPDQRFFLAYATLWAGNIRDEQIRVYTKSDPHSLGRTGQMACKRCPASYPGLVRCVQHHSVRSALPRS